MGKRMIAQQASEKASKNEKQLHNLIKVLKPMVYITDSSSFKQLVQELTGYRTTAPKPEQVHEKVPVIEIEDQLDGETPAAATVLSMDSSFSSFELCDNIDQAFDQLEEINQVTGLIQTADEIISTFEDAHVNSLSTNEQTNWLAYQNLESWLLDAADQPYSYNNSYNNGFSSSQNNVQDYHHQVSLFDDYELSGLI